MIETKQAIKDKLNTEIKSLNILFKKYLLLVLLFVPITFLALIPVLNRDSRVKGLALERKISPITVNEFGVIEISYLELASAFYENPKDTMPLFKDKSVQFEASVQGIENINNVQSIVLNPSNSVSYMGLQLKCTMKETLPSEIHEGDKVFIKGEVYKKDLYLFLKDCVSLD